MTLLTYNPTKNARITYLGAHALRPLSVTKKKYAINLFSVLLVLMAIVFAVLYFREVLFYSAIANNIVILQEQNQDLTHQNQSLKNTLSKLESLDNLRISAEKIGLVKPVNIIYPLEIHYTLR